MKTTIITAIIVGVVISGGFAFVYATYDELFSPLIESYLFGECELEIFSGDDGVCVQKNQIADLDWSSIESCKQTGKLIECAPDVYPRFESEPEPTTLNEKTWVSLPVKSCGYPWHESKHEKTGQYYNEYKSTVEDYDSSSWQDVNSATHYVIMRYYEDLGITVFDVKTSRDSSLAGMGEGCDTTVGGTWHLEILNSDLSYFLNNGYDEQETLCFIIDSATSGESGSAVSLEKCIPLSDLNYLGCDKPILEHLFKYSNLLDEEFHGVYGIEDIGLPDGVSQEFFEECVDYIYEKRISIGLENEN